VVFSVIVAGCLVWLALKFYRARPAQTGVSSRIAVGAPLSSPPSIQAPPLPSSITAESWTSSRIKDALGEIDWYQFEKFCGALLRSEGFRVERKGGAQPDGGVDLICEKDAVTTLVQCKHWRTWTVQEKVIRELLGSMTHFQAKRGALYTLKGWTRPAEAFAAQHDIILVDAAQLARRAKAGLSDQDLSTLLNSREHHCPKCESPMIWKTGNFSPFWGCSTFPRCRGILSGAH
jgi:restriction system protein